MSKAILWKTGKNGIGTVVGVELAALGMEYN